VIIGFVGLIGAGKTMLAVKHAVELARRRDALLVSNIGITAPGVDVLQLATGDDGLDVAELQTVVDAAREKREQRIAESRAKRDAWARRPGCGLVLLLDEVGILMPARFWASFPVSLMFTLSQSRKLAIDVIYTAQDVEQIDAFLRRLTQWVYRVRSIPGASIEKRQKGRRPWFFYVTRWRPATVDRPDKRLGRDFIRYRRPVEGWYSTDELVAPPDRLTKGRRPSRSAA
jgi:hypothetical protein